MVKKITNRKVGKYTVVEDTVRIGQDTYKTEELMSDKELKLLQAKKCTCNPKKSKYAGRYKAGTRYPITSEYYSDNALEAFAEMKAEVGVRKAREWFYRTY